MDTERMKASFAKVASAGDEVPLFFYSHLFLSHPETRAMFPVSMMQQRDRLLTALGNVVARVDDLDALVPILVQLGRDHRKFGTLADHYPAVGASLLVTLQHFAGEDWTPELAADWAAAYELVAKVMVDAAEEASDEPAWWDAKVVSHDRRTPDIAVVELQTEPRLDYLPGQSVSVETPLRPRLWRYYSPARAPRDDGLVEIHVRLMDGGPVSSALVRGLGVGDVVHLGPPVGQFTLDLDSDRDLLFIAGGTGLAPLKAMVEQVAQQDDPPRVDLYVGARGEQDLYDTEDLERLENTYPWLSVTAAVSDGDGYAGRHGRISDVVVADGPWGRRDVYICGSPEMVKATTARLIEAKVPEHRIRSEEFAPSWPGPQAEGGVVR